MSEREIRCNRCNCYVGVIRDAKLMVGLAFTCPKCVTIDYDNHDDFLNTTTANKNYNKKDSWTDMFNDILSGDYKNTPFK